jgi:hypothetical protein
LVRKGNFTEIKKSVNIEEEGEEEMRE